MLKKLTTDLPAGRLTKPQVARLPLPRLLPWLFAVACLLAISNTAYSQSRPKLSDVNQRLIRVENVLDQSLFELLQQIRDLESDLRVLRGDIESQANEISRLRRAAGNQSGSDDLEQRLLSVERQLRTLSGGDSGDGSEFNSGSTDSVSPDSDAASGIVSGEVKTATGAETAAYQKAKRLLDDGDYDAAIAGFEDFLTSFPGGAFSDNALYWQGEAMYAQRSFEDAIINFNVMIESFPQSAKVPDAFLKIAFSHFEQERYADARTMLEQIVSAYSGRSAAVLAQRRLSEMDSAGL